MHIAQNTFGLRLFARSALWTLALCSGLAGATTITYDVSETDAATNRWRYDYTITNASISPTLNEFTIFFQLGTYENLSVVAGPAGWDSLVAQPDPNLPDNGFFDSLATAGGLTPGSSLGIFSVSFIYHGTGTPGNQIFNILDANFQTIDQGSTRPNGVAAVPEPATGFLFSATLLGYAVRRRRNNCSTQN
jgi:hypothetical protein